MLMHFQREILEDYKVNSNCVYYADFTNTDEPLFSAKIKTFHYEGADENQDLFLAALL